MAGARPNFMKIAPLMAAFGERPEITPLLVHTGQHYDRVMSDLFFRELGIPEPDLNLGVGSASHAVQTAEIMKAFEPIIVEEKPDAVLVVGDVNSTIACGLVAVKLGVKLIHVEAGLRSFDRTMPEEINRLLTDSISDLLFCSEPSGVENLRREGVAEEKIHLVGNVMIDTLLRNRDKAEASTILDTLHLNSGRPYAVVTLHRPSNVDDPVMLDRIMTVLEEIGREMPVVFPVHPRTRARLNGVTSSKSVILENGPDAVAENANFKDLTPGLMLIDPLGYLDFLKLMAHARIVLTDSGGIQEETTILGTPCLTLRENTERPITVEMGTNRLVGSEPERIMRAYREVVGGEMMSGGPPPLWDGQAAQRIAAVICDKLRKPA
ncbi:MAG TPA: UDP-N-acetylglucosamine 2-epimerase (non-hydrolyzing) [Syntrophales bacterium]|nr:UDP-N-acetylglucosamine 2-epimerase (non-hydrolyzing) [Syntrophales bacterium]